jgi:DNA-binding winged helix-turn-helix (wHTH) protein
MERAVRVRFGRFVFDSQARDLVRDGERVPLSPKAFRFLELLLEGAPRAYTKAEITDALWPQTFVSEASLTRLAAEARAALEDDARTPKFIRTVYGHGYSFMGVIDSEPSSIRRGWPGVSAFSVLIGRREVPLWEGENVIGRTSDCAVHVVSTSVSRHHARILVNGDSARLEDMGSKNGTYLRGRRLDAVSELTPGDEIRVGPVVLCFQCAARDRATDTDIL